MNLHNVILPPHERGRVATLREIESAMLQGAQAIFPVVGECLEGAGVQDGGWVAVDFTKYPAPRYKSKDGDESEDLCLCYAAFPGAPGPRVMCKAYCGVWGHWQMVGTRYKHLWEGRDKLRMNCAMPAWRIFGVIFGSWSRAGKLLWERAPESFPDRLDHTPSIGGDVMPWMEATV